MIGTFILEYVTKHGGQGIDWSERRRKVVWLLNVLTNSRFDVGLPLGDSSNEM